MKLNTGKLAIFSLVLNVLFVLFFISKRIYYSGFPQVPIGEKFEDIWDRSRCGVFNELLIDSTDIVFVGNSITEGFPVNEMFPGIHVKNRGIGANRTRHVLQRIDSILKYKPRKIFLEIGVNDLSDIGMTVDSVFNNYKRIVSKIIIQSPQSQLIIQSLMPVCGERIKHESEIIELNKRLFSYCQQQKICYVDLFTPLAKNGQLDSIYTEDGIHPNGKGYVIWKRQIDNLVK